MRETAAQKLELEIEITEGKGICTEGLEMVVLSIFGSKNDGYRYENSFVWGRNNINNFLIQLSESK